MKTFQPKSPLLDALGRQPRPGEKVRTPGGAEGWYVGTTQTGTDYVAYTSERYPALRHAFLTRVAEESASLRQVYETAQRTFMSSTDWETHDEYLVQHEAYQTLTAAQDRLAVISGS